MTRRRCGGGGGPVVQRTGPARLMRVSRWPVRPSAVTRLVRRLDGMPLAIELAAARVEALGVTQLADRLDGWLALLAGGDRLAAGRHRSLAAAAQWSYQLLAEHERRVFRQVSVFPGAVHPGGGRGDRGPGGGGGGAAPGGVLAAGSAAARPGWPDAVRDAGDAARLRRRIAGRGRGPGPGRGRVGRVCTGRCRASRGGAAGQRRARRPRPGGSTPRTPLWAMCWPGRWSVTWTRRCGWWAS